MIAMRPGLTRPQHDLLSRLSFRWPWPCFLVVTGRGTRSLVVTEMSESRSLARVCGYAQSTVRGLAHDEQLIQVGEAQAMPDYSWRSPIDSTVGFPVSITSRGCVAIGVPTLEQRLGLPTESQRAALENLKAGSE